MLRSVTERFEATTTVRQPRVLLMWALVAIMVAMMGFAWFMRAYYGRSWGPLMQMPWWMVGPAFAAIQRRPKIETLAVTADAEGLRLGSRMVPRAKLKSAVLRCEAAGTYVLLRGVSSLGFSSYDVAVPNEDAADRLCSALALDAQSTTAEFVLQRRGLAIGKAVVAITAAFIALSFAAIMIKAILAPVVILAFALALVAIGVPLAVFHHRVKLIVGADGLVVQEGLGKRRFISHGDIEDVRAGGSAVIVKMKHGSMQFDVGAAGRGKRNQQDREFEVQAQSIAWRIEKAREAYRALAGAAPQAALALDRGSKSTREWIDQLKRIGEGASATFRSVGLTREQLLRVVESTSASARERLAAAVALRTGLTDDEKPRIRVAADRCAEPALRERMVRVAFAPSDEELAAALEEEEAVSASSDAATR
jgi:hypothetical protein